MTSINVIRRKNIDQKILIPMINLVRYNFLLSFKIERK